MAWLMEGDCWRTEPVLSSPQPVLWDALSVKVRWRLVSVVVTVLFSPQKLTEDLEEFWLLPRSPMPLKQCEGPWAQLRSRVLSVSSPVSLFVSLCRYPSICPQIWYHMELQWRVRLAGCLVGRQKVHLPPSDSLPGWPKEELFRWLEMLLQGAVLLQVSQKPWDTQFLIF